MSHCGLVDIEDLVEYAASNFRVGDLVYPEDRDGMFLRNVDRYVPVYMVLHPRRQSSS